MRALAFAISALVALGLASPAMAQSVRLGLLDCKPTGAGGLLFGAGTPVECMFQPNAGAPAAYAGLIETATADLAVRPNPVFAWQVEVPTGAPSPQTLNGEYVGEASAAGSAAGSTRALRGGASAGIRLAPASVMSASSVNLASGVSLLKLQAK